MSEVVACNKCGQCCSVGGSCALRPWTPFKLKPEFEGICDLLTESNECSVMMLAKEQGLWEKCGFGRLITGVCNFVELKIENVPKQ